MANETITSKPAAVPSKFSARFEALKAAKEGCLALAATFSKVSTELGDDADRFNNTLMNRARKINREMLDMIKDGSASSKGAPASSDKLPG